MPSRHEIKRHDTRPYWPVTLKYSDGSIANVSGGTVTFIAKRRWEGTVKVSVAATITDGPNGQVEWRPQASETDEAGDYDVEWQVVFADATEQTFPTRGYDRLRIYEDLDNA